MVKKSTFQLDKLENQPIVKSSEQETPPDDAINAIRGLTDHADLDSMAAESNSNRTLSSRQLLPSAVGDFSVSRQVEYCPPPDTVIGQYARDVCDELIGVAHSEKTAIETRQGFREFMTVVAGIMAKQANARGVQWTTQSEPSEK